MPPITPIVNSFDGTTMRTSGWADFSSALRDVGQLKAAAVTGLSDAACLAKG